MLIPFKLAHLCATVLLLITFHLLFVILDLTIKKTRPIKKSFLRFYSPILKISASNSKAKRIIASVFIGIMLYLVVPACVAYYVCKIPARVELIEKNCSETDDLLVEQGINSRKKYDKGFKHTSYIAIGNVSVSSYSICPKAFTTYIVNNTKEEFCMRELVYTSGSFKTDSEPEKYIIVPKSVYETDKRPEYWFDYPQSKSSHSSIEVAWAVVSSKDEAEKEEMRQSPFL
ncbi:MAG: hypothetical protein J6X86_07510 [Bacteroidales bacterium]|nr:hypothetical protein [Bacteroidales bacterium]